MSLLRLDHTVSAPMRGNWGDGSDLDLVISVKRFGEPLSERSLVRSATRTSVTPVSSAGCSATSTREPAGMSCWSD